MKPLLQVLILWCCTSSYAWAQVELLVQLHANAETNLSQALNTFDAAAKTQPFPELFAGVTQVGRTAEGTTTSVSLFRLTTADSTAGEDLLSAWQQRADVHFAQFNHRYSLDGLPTDPDPLADSLGHLLVIRALDAWQITRGVPSIRVGFVDTGVWVEHPDLNQQLWINPGEDTNGNGARDAADFNGRDDDGNGLVDDILGYDFVDRAYSVEVGDYRERDGWADEDPERGGGRGHGTTVAGVLAAIGNNGIGISGVAPQVSLVPLRAFGADGQGDDDDIAAAILYGADLDLDVINLSFGDVHYSPIMHESIRYAVEKGVVVVASAGNLGGDRPHYPSDYPEVISVAWLTEDGSRLAGRGTHGIGIDIGAPASNIYTTLFPAISQDASVSTLYGRRSGSSMAAPMVAGAAALLKATDSSLSPATIRNILLSAANDIDDNGWDHLTAAGRLDVFGALLEAVPGRTEITHPNLGISEEEVVIVGSSIHPAFEGYQIFFAGGDEAPFSWQPITEQIKQQVIQDTLASWNTTAIPEGVYTLRLITFHSGGQTVEERRRLFVDRSEPVVRLPLFSQALVDAKHGFAIDVETDDVTEVALELLHQGRTHHVSSDRIARRHGLVWADDSGLGGAIELTIVATNQAGLSTSVVHSIVLPRLQTNTALFTETALNVPAGFLLPEATDFDRDGLAEIVLNRYENGWIGDSLQVYEWDGTDFRLASSLVANVIPRDVGDSNRNGRQEVMTQVGGATLLIEQASLTAFPSAAIYVDTTGLANPFSPESAFGAQITDLDQDGRGELLVHNTKEWRILEQSGNTYVEVAVLSNPTGTGQSEIESNEYQEPEAIIADLDGDGQTNVLVGDADGDWVIYENTGNNSFASTWQFETERYNAGSRLASGNIVGGQLPEFITYSQNWTQIASNHERQPDMGLIYLWQSLGDDQYEIVDSLALPGKHSRHGTITTANVTGDSYDEIILVNAPYLYVLSWVQGEWVIHYATDDVLGTMLSGWRSVAISTHDFNVDGFDDIVAARADGRMWHLARSGAGSLPQPPVWSTSFARNNQIVALHWLPNGADSVSVYASQRMGTFDRIAVTTTDSLEYRTSEPATFRLQGWFGGQATPLSTTISIRPHLPTVVENITYPSPDQILLAFSEHLAAQIDANQFQVEGEPLVRVRSITRPVLQNELLLSLSQSLEGISRTLTWSNILDAEGTPVGQTSILLEPSAISETVLTVTSWAWLDARKLRVVFSEPIASTTATDRMRYTVSPVGDIETITFDSDDAKAVIVQFVNFGYGVNGEEPMLIIKGIEGLSGSMLSAEGVAIQLEQRSRDLANVRVFPNPLRMRNGSEQIQVRGILQGSTVRVINLLGETLRVFQDVADSAIVWDARDEQGTLIPSGVYFIHVEHSDGGEVLRKVAVIR